MTRQGTIGVAMIVEHNNISSYVFIALETTCQIRTVHVDVLQGAEVPFTATCPRVHHVGSATGSGLGNQLHVRTIAPHLPEKNSKLQRSSISTTALGRSGAAAAAVVALAVAASDEGSGAGGFVMTI